MRALLSVLVASACSAPRLGVPTSGERCTPPAIASEPLVPALPQREPLAVRPVLFLPRDAEISEEDSARARDALREHLELARSHYQRLLRLDTFRVDWSGSWEHRSEHGDAHFTERPPDGADSAHEIASELLAWQHENRFDSSRIYLTLYVRPPDRPFTGGPGYFGGGRTFNGAPGTGGGYVEMEYTSLLSDTPYPFQSTLVHELGHAFGLTHVDCLGRDASTDGSIMSLNPAHHSRGVKPSSDPGGFNAEEVLVLSLNRRAFPDLRYCEEMFGPVEKSTDQIAACFLGPMSREIGDFVDMPDVGYELFYDGARVNGPEAALYSFRSALANCSWATKQHPGITVECRYNGEPFSP